MSRKASAAVNTARLVQAGAILSSPVDSVLADTITARRYAHPALDDRVVVRLVPSTLGPAEDLAMEFLGFAQSGCPAAVGSGRRQALGFPAWAIVNDPANGQHALALVKDVERLSRMARSKPGNAKEGFDLLADELGKTVPHFLPSFFEQAGRAFLAVDNKPTAAVFFGKAREAERVHALAVDEDAQRDVFLEFAFAGALTAKSLTQHSRDLATRSDPLQAYELFLRICVERVGGGLPPYAGMAEDLRRLVKAAGLDAAKEDERLLLELLEAPTLTRAPLAFWKAYRPALVRLAKSRVDIRSHLLNMFPSRSQEGVEEFWFDLLEAAGAYSGLTETANSKAIGRPRDGASGWLTRALEWRLMGRQARKRSTRLLALVEEMAPRLRVEGRPIDLQLVFYQRVELDVLDLCLSLGLDIKRPERLPPFSLEGWVADPSPGRRDLSALAALDWAWAPLLTALDQLLDRRLTQPANSRPLDVERLRPLLEATGTRKVLRLWLDSIADEAEAGALPGLHDCLVRLSRVASDFVLAVSPGAAGRLAALDPGVALARTLRMGLLDELEWPALEGVMPEFPVDKTLPLYMQRAKFADSWPALVLLSSSRATAVGPDGVLLRHDFRFPAAQPPLHRMARAYYVDGQFLIAWLLQSGREAVGYWSNRPHETFEVPRSLAFGPRFVEAQTLPLPTGGSTGGGRPLLAGERDFSVTRLVASDGTSWWRFDEGAWREFDPRTGNLGRRSLPAFFEAGLSTSGAKLEAEFCRLALAPPELQDSPLGVADGLLGWRATRLPDGTAIGESVDGSVVEHPAGRRGPGSHSIPVSSLRLPDGSRVGVLRQNDVLRFWDGTNVGSEFTPGDRFPPYARGTAVVPPVGWWHCLRPRDEEVSKILRGVTDEQGRALLAAAKDGPAAVQQVLPAITDPRLIAGVAGVVGVAALCAQAISELPLPGEPAALEPVAVDRISDVVTASALAGICTRTGAYESAFSFNQALLADTSAVAALESAMAAFSDSPDRAQSFASSRVDWTCLVGGLGAVALRAASPATSVEHRAALVALLEAAVGTPLLEKDRWRTLLLSQESEQDLPIGAVIKTSGGSAVVVNVATSHSFQTASRTHTATALEHSPTETFADVPGFRVKDTRVAGEWGDTGRVRQLLDLLAERGPAPWRPEAVQRLADSTGITRAEAGLLLAGLPNIEAYGHNFLLAEVREVLGLKTAEAAAAKSTLAKLNPSSRMLLCGLAMPGNPADLWDRGPDVDAVARTWVATFGQRVSVPETLVAALNSAVKHRNFPAATLLQGLADPAGCAWLSTDKQWAITNNELVGTGSKDAFSGDALVPAVSALLWLAYQLRLDDPLRAALPTAFASLQSRLANPELLVRTLWGDGLAGLGRAYGHPAPQFGPRTPTVTLALGSSGVLVASSYWQTLYLRPAHLSGPSDPLLDAGGTVVSAETVALKLVADPRVHRLLQTASAGASGWAQDPAVSVPALVPTVAAALDLDEPAARLYLQVLALPDPTDKNVLKWNDWTAATLKKARGSLVDAGLLIDAKRARAGRTGFLPGGWLDVKAPMLPVEDWKVPLLELLPDGRGPLGITIAPMPVAELFESAWARISSGDRPAFGQLQTGRRR